MTARAAFALVAVSALAAASRLTGVASGRGRARRRRPSGRRADPVAGMDAPPSSPAAPSDALPRDPDAATSHAQDEFLATLSHELRTPLTSIVGWASLLKLGRLDEVETARALETILRSAAAQAQIIDELLDASRIITGKILLDLRSVEVGAIVKSAVDTVTPAASAKDIRIQLVLDPAGSWIAGDPDRLQQVFWNLLFNAVKFTPRNGRVRVGVHSVGADVAVVVDDTGVGIQPEFLPRMFERFTQGDSSSTRAVRGLGLGLSIARQLAELHGGTIRAESAGVGYGATFTASFPRSPTTGDVPALALGACTRIVQGLRAPHEGFQLHLAQPVQPSEPLAAFGGLAAGRG